MRFSVLCLAAFIRLASGCRDVLHSNVHELPAYRSYFYVGGQYVSNPEGGTLLDGQMYVEQLRANQHRLSKYPIIFIHGKAQTGTNWLNTPDGREGWASWFLRHGHDIYIVDQPRRGRSSYNAKAASISSAFTAEEISKRFTGVRHYNLWPQAHLHTQWPGNGSQGDPVFDQFYASQIQYETNATLVSELSQKAGATLLDMIGPSIVVTHSQAGTIGYLLADIRPDLVKALVQIEPEGPPFENRVIYQVPGKQPTVRPWGLTNLPMTYDPPVHDITRDLRRVVVPPANQNLTDCIRQADPPRKLVNLARVPMLIVTAEASYHSAYDHCTVGYLKQAGVEVEHLDLSKVNIRGNGHFLFMEKNSKLIAKKIEEWIDTVVKP